MGFLGRGQGWKLRGSPIGGQLLVVRLQGRPREPIGRRWCNGPPRLELPVSTATEGLKEPLRFPPPAPPSGGGRAAWI